MQEEKPELAAIRKWNLFLEHMISAKQAWQIFLEHRRNVRDFDNLPRGAGKFLGLATSRSTFEIASQRLMDYARKYEGGFQGMIVKLEPEQKKEEVKDGRRIQRERKS
jgi:hypothetical protein